HRLTPRLPPPDAVLEEVLRAFLVVHDERDGDARAIRPADAWRLVRIADQITFHMFFLPVTRFTVRTSAPSGEQNGERTVARAPGVAQNVRRAVVPLRGTESR